MIDYEKLINWESTEEAYANAQRMFTSARTVGAEGNFGLASSLMVLYREETQKSLLMAFVSSGFYDIQNPDIKEELDQCFRFHRYKIASSWLVNAFVAYIIADLQALLLGPNPTPESVEKVRQAIQTSIENLKREATGGTTALDMLKQAGLYVGPDRGGTWRTPSSISADVYSKLESSTASHLLVVGLAIGLLKRDDLQEDWKRAAREFRRIISERPRDPLVLEALEKTGQLGGILAGFCRFLQSANLIDAYGSSHKLPKSKSK